MDPRFEPRAPDDDRHTHVPADAPAREPAGDDAGARDEDRRRSAYRLA